MSSEPSQELESDTTEYSEGTADSGRRGFGTDSEYFTLRRGSSSGIPESAEWVDPEPPEWVEPVPGRKEHYFGQCGSCGSTSVMVSHMPTLLQGHAMSTYMLISQSMSIPKDVGHTELSNFVGFAKVKGGSGIFQLVQK